MRHATVLLFIASLLVSQDASAVCMTFTDEASFEAFVEDQGKLQKGVETFEESNMQGLGKQPLPAPLGSDPNVVGGLGFPSGLAQPNLVIWDNQTPGPAPLTLNPSGSPFALYVLAGGFIGSNSKKVGEDLFLLDIWASIDLVFTDDDKTAVGFELSRFDGFGSAGWQVGVFDIDGDLVGVFPVAAPPSTEPTKSFFGVWCDAPIGRINVFDEAGPDADAIDNIQMWFQAPTPTETRSWGHIKSVYQ